MALRRLSGTYTWPQLQQDISAESDADVRDRPIRSNPSVANRRSMAKSSVVNPISHALRLVQKQYGPGRLALSSIATVSAADLIDRCTPFHRTCRH